MKNITILILIVFCGCNSGNNKISENATESSTNQHIKDFSWLDGVWERSMSGDSTMNHFETWTIDSSGIYGTGITILEDEVTEEKMWIITQNDSLFYKAHPQQNKTSTLFYITEIKDSFFRSENTWHDFPKYIEYKCVKDSLHAFIGDDNQRIAFKFRKQDERDIR